MEKHIFLQSEQIYLRALEEQDLTGPYFDWLNDEEVCRYNSHAVFPNNARKMRDYFERAQTATDAVILAVVAKKTDQHIGNISLQNISWINRSAEIAFLLGDKNAWGKGVMHEAGKLLIEYGFVRLNLHRIHCGTSAENQAMQKLALKLGMKEEGVRKEAMYKNGKYVDVVEYAILRND